LAALYQLQVRAKQLDITGIEEQMAKLDGMLKEARTQTEKVQKEYNAMSEKVCVLWTALSTAVHLVAASATAGADIWHTVQTESS
jgi:hypothetical protein